MVAHRDDDGFRPKVGPPKAKGRGSSSRFIGEVIKRTSKAARTLSPRATYSKSPIRPKSKLANFGRGQVAAKLLQRTADPHSRRVAVKIRLVNLRQAHRQSTQRHLRYIERDGVTREGGRGQLFNALTDEADALKFKEHSQNDRHQFRIMVSPEEGHEIVDLKAFARDLMSQVERDLGTRLEWVGVDHWDTDDPHLHLVVRGKDEQGQDLVIAPGYIAHGMRARAAEIATDWLGPRTEREIQESLTREVTQERWTSLDHAIQQQSRDGLIVIRDRSNDAAGRKRTSLLVGRLDQLSQMGLTEKTAPLAYRLSPRLETTLRAMGERGDIVRTLQRAMGREQRQYVMFDHTAAHGQIVGKIVSKGLRDELSEHGYLVIDGIDGRAHYVKLDVRRDLDEFPLGAIAQIQAAVPRKTDRTIESLAQDGLYRTAQHQAAAQLQAREGFNVDTYVQAHVRRLEALRRAGLVERIEDGVWRVPTNLSERARIHDSARSAGARVEIRSRLAIEQQRRALGATWLDSQLVGSTESLATTGFGAEVRQALSQRVEFLIEQGFAERRGQRIVLARNLLESLRNREVDEVARRIEVETGLPHWPVVEGQTISGTYRRSVSLVSGQFAVLDHASGFSLVPWRPVLEHRLGQPLTAVVRGDFVSWEVGRQRGLSR